MSQSEPTQSSGTSGQTSGTTKKKKTVHVVLALSIVVIIALLGTVIYLLTRPQEAPAPQATDGVRATIVTPENVDEVKNKEKVGIGYYSCKMNVDWNFKDSSSPSYNAYVANSENNNNTVYFDLILDETGELLYSSPYIPVGSELEDITLDANLKAGDYSATVTYHLVDEENNELSTVSVAVTLHVEN